MNVWAIVNRNISKSFQRTVSRKYYCLLKTYCQTDEYIRIWIWWCIWWAFTFPTLMVDWFIPLMWIGLSRPNVLFLGIPLIFFLEDWQCHSPSWIYSIITLLCEERRFTYKKNKTESFWTPRVTLSSKMGKFNK